MSVNKTMKSRVQKVLQEFKTICQAGIDYQGYTETDMYNASYVFMHFLLDLSYTKNKNKSLEEKIKIATKSGRGIRKLILESTGIDMHKVSPDVSK